MSDTAVAVSCFVVGGVFAAIAVAAHWPALLGLAFGFPVAVFIISRADR